MRRAPRAFTLVELTLALGIMVVVSGLVIVRLGGWSPRQRVISTANSIGNTFSLYREMARNQERLYAMVLEPDVGMVSIYAPLERQKMALNNSTIVHRFKVPEGMELQFSSTSTEQPYIVYFDGTGVVPHFEVRVLQGDHSIVLRADAIANRIDYEEK